MTTLRQQLSEAFQSACEQVGIDRSFGTVVWSQRPELGQFQCNGALPAAKQAGKNPRELAEEIIAALPDNQLIAETSIAGPGFINVNVTDTALVGMITAAAADDRAGIQALSDGRKTTVDYGGYNVAKTLHVGHLRPTVIGECLKRILRFMGDETTGDVHLGDWGTQMGMVIVGIQMEQPDLPYFDEDFTGEYPTECPVTVADLERIYPKMSGATKEDPELKARALEATAKLQSGHPGYTALWQQFVDLTINAMKETTNLLGAHYELWNGESHYHERMGTMVADLKERGVAVESEGALIIDITSDDVPEHSSTNRAPKEMPPLMLTKSDGAYLYSTSDLATLQERAEDLDQEFVLYVIDQRQGLHIQQVFAAANKIGMLEKTGVYHCGFGTMNGPDGKPFKTRKGDAMRLQDLIQQTIDRSLERMDEVQVAKELSAEERTEISQLVGLAAIKFAELINDPKTNYIFDIDAFTQFEGKTGPYLLYSAVRMKSILRKTDDAGYAAGELQVANEHDRALMLKLAEMGDVLEMIYREYTPHLLAHYVFELAQEFNNFYQHCNIMNQEDEAVRGSWIALTAATLKHLEIGLNLLTIEVPERM